MTIRTRVKICGITREQDLHDAVALGADAIGLVFHDPSPRAVDLEQASVLAAAAPAFVTVTGLFVDPEPARVRAVLDAVPLGALQFHGAESPELCASFGRPWLKALAMRDGLYLEAEARRYAGASSLLLDAFDPVIAGGIGRCFDWTRIPSLLAPDIILAGGLNPDNVTEAIRTVRPYGVDVSGGVEASKGIKDRVKLEHFFQGVRDGDQCR